MTRKLLCLAAALWLLAAPAGHADTINLGGATVPKANGGTAAATGSGAAATLSHPYIICQNGSNSGHSTTSGSEVNIASCTIPANTIGAGGGLKITTLWSFASSTNSKTIIIRLGTAAGTGGTSFLTDAFSTSGQQNARCTTIVWNRAAANSQVGAVGAANCSGGASGGGAPTTGAIDTTAQSVVNLDGNTNGTETLTLEAYTVEILPPGGN
jgi:hypothetical protein